MVCKKCGNHIPDGLLFCSQCGAPVDMEDLPKWETQTGEDMLPEQDAQDDRDPDEMQWDEPDDDGIEDPQQQEMFEYFGKLGRKQRRIKQMILAGICAVIVAIGVVIGMNFAAILNWGVRVFCSPEDIFVSVYKRIFSETIELGSELAEMQDPEENALQGQIHLVFGQQVVNVLAKQLGVDAALLQPLQELTLNSRIDADERYRQACIELSAAQLARLSVVTVHDLENSRRSLYLPQIHPQAIVFEDAAEKNTYPSSNDFTGEALRYLLSQTEFRKLSVLYFGELLEMFTLVEKSTETVSVLDRNEKQMVLKAAIYQPELISALVGICEQMKLDMELEQLVRGLSEQYNSYLNKNISSMGFSDSSVDVNLYDLFIQKLDACITELSAQMAQAQGSNAVTLYTYLNMDNLPIGFRLEVTQAEPVYWMTAGDKAQRAVKLSAGGLMASGTVCTTESVSCDIAIVIGEEELGRLTASELTLADGNVSGTVCFIPAYDMVRDVLDSMELGLSGDFVALSDVSFSMDFSLNEEKSTTELSLLINDTSVLDVFVSVACAEGNEIVFPNDFVDGDQETVLYQWLQELDFSELLDVFLKIGQS